MVHENENLELILVPTFRVECELSFSFLFRYVCNWNCYYKTCKGFLCGMISWGLFWLLHIALSLNWVFIFSSVSSGFEFVIRKGGFLVRPDRSVWLLRKVRERRKQNKILELTLAIEFSHEG